MEGDWLIFVTVFLLTLALFMFLAGAFTVYFGSGKSRAIGAFLFIGGIIIGLIVALLYQQDIISTAVPLWTVIRGALVVLIAAVLGALAAIGMFLFAIMKS